MEGMTRRDFIKGMGALALIPFIPNIGRPEPEKLTPRYMRLSIKTEAHGDPATVTVQKSIDGIHWDNTGTLITPHKNTRLKVDYEVVDGNTEIIGMEDAEVH